MQTLSIGRTDLHASRIAYGCMRTGGAWDAEPLSRDIERSALASLRAALDAGINFFDHADIYARGKSEAAFAQLWLQSPGLRPQVYVQSKCGIRFADDPVPGDPHRFDFSREHIVRSVEGSLNRLGTDYLDVLLLHRPDPLVEPEEVAEAFDELHAAGKVRYFGVSNHNAAQIKLLRAYLRQPLVANQVEINPLHTQLFDEGVHFNQENPPVPLRGEGTVEYCRLHGITLQAWGPLAGGRLTGRRSTGQGPGARRWIGRAKTAENRRVIEASQVVAGLAQKYGISGEAVVIAWLLRHPAGIQPIIGTTDPGRITAACQADSVVLNA